MSLSSQNICAQTELGWKSFRQRLYERQLKFYFRVLYLNERRWSHQALLEHLSGSWPSPYLEYISSIRSKLGIYAAPSVPRVWKSLSYSYFLESTNQLIQHISSLKPILSFSRLPYVCESKWSAVISEFRLECEGLGNKQPRHGYSRKHFCPVCPDVQLNCGIHLLFCCSSLSALRLETGITAFLNSCTMQGITMDDSYGMFINGLDSNNQTVSQSAFLERARCMYDMRLLWLTKW